MHLGLDPGIEIGKGEEVGGVSGEARQRLGLVVLALVGGQKAAFTS